MERHHKPRCELEKELSAIYAAADGTMPDLTQMEAAPRSRLSRGLTRAILAVGALSLVSWAGFFAWTRFSGSDERPLTASLEGPATVRALEEVTYAVRYGAATDVPLAQLELSLNLPASFRLVRALPPPDEGSTWRLGSLSGGSDGEVLVTGHFRDQVPSSQTLQASFTYRPANFSSDFRDFRSLPVHVDGTMLEVAATGPDKALPGDPVTYSFEVRNGSGASAEGVRLTAELPKDFRFASSSLPPSSPGALSWDLPPIAPAAVATVTLTGSFTASAEGTQAVSAAVALVEGGQALPQGKALARTDMLGGAFDFRLVVNGGTGDLALDPGGALRVSVDYANRGKDTLFGVEFRLSAEAGTRALPVDWEAATGIMDGVRSGTSLAWGKDAVPALEALAPGAEGTIDVTLPLRASVDPAADADLFPLTLTMSVQKVGSVASPRTVSVTPIMIAINSDFSASAQARYFTPEGEPVGTGPLPPMAGSSTSYRVYWSMENRLHPLSGTRMSATLPTDAGWAGRTDASAGTLAYDETTRTVSWTVDKWPDGTPAVRGWFDVTTLPSESDAGSLLRLVNASGAEATDTVTKARLSRVIPELTSELPEDADARGKGVVVPKE